MLKTALFARALELEKDKKYDDAAKSFLGFQSEFPKDDDADKALFNATVNFYRIGAVEKALAAGKMILDSYPKSKLTDEVLINSAQTYESLAQFDQAAKYYELYADKYPSLSKASGALFNAAILNKGLHRFEKSVVLYQQFASRYPKDNLVADALFEIAKLKERLKDYDGAIAAYNAYSSKMKKDPEQQYFADAKAAELTLKHVSAKKGRPMLSTLYKDLTRKDAPAAFDARNLVASLYFNNLDSDFVGFKKIAIDNPDKIEKQIEAKQKSLMNLAGRYQKVIELASGEYTVASLYRLGEMHEQFSSQLLNVPSGNSATQMEIDKLRTELEKLALPLKDEAYKFFETANQRSAEVVNLSDWTKRTYNKLSELNAEKYPEVLEKVSDAEYMSHKLDIDKTVAELTE
jgi:TolA-binding protein